MGGYLGGVRSATRGWGRWSVARWAAIALAAGCRAAVPIVYQVEPTPTVVGCAPSGCAPAEEQVEITYLGVGGFLVRYRGAALLTAPMFSNPPLARVAPPSLLRAFARRGGPIAPDTGLVDRLLPREADAASMLLVGHGHYDHLLDVPWVATRRATRASVYGSPTTRHILMGDSLLRREPARLVALTGADVGDARRAGRWAYSPDSAFRVMALAADHAPTLGLFGRGPLFAAGTVDRDLDALPRFADGWKAGEPLAFLIDVLRRGDPTGARPRLRIYYQDAPSTPPLGFPPLATIAERPVDVALLCAATARNVPDTPERLVEALKPGYVVVGHWESFFRPQTLPIVLNVATDADRFLGALARHLPPTSGWQMPLPRTTLRFDLR
jgi:L-ascorbate metabolism protein UlaG (beta-lactamase superfamily)